MDGASIPESLLPYIIGGAFTLLGTAIGGCLNFALNAQKARQERETLKIRLAYERDDAATKIKFEKIEKTFITLHIITENILKIAEIKVADDKQKFLIEVHNRVLNNLLEIDLLCMLYLSELKSSACDLRDTILPI